MAGAGDFEEQKLARRLVARRLRKGRCARPVQWCLGRYLRSAALVQSGCFLRLLLEYEVTSPMTPYARVKCVARS